MADIVDTAMSMDAAPEDTGKTRMQTEGPMTPIQSVAETAGTQNDDDMEETDAEVFSDIGPSITIMWSGYEWEVERELFMKHSQLCASLFGQEYNEHEVLEIPDDQDYITAESLDCVIDFINEDSQGCQPSFVRGGGGLAGNDKVWLRNVEDDLASIRELPGFYKTAAYLGAPSVIPMLDRAATNAFNALMIFKGTNKRLPDHLRCSELVSEALGLAFEPESWQPKPVSDEILAAAAQNQLRDADGMDDTLPEQGPVGPAQHIKTEMTSPGNNTNNNTTQPAVQDSPGLPGQTYDGLPFYMIPLHPAYESLRKVYLRCIFVHRHDLLNNYEFLLYLSRTPHLSAKLLLHIAAAGGVGIAYQFDDRSTSSPSLHSTLAVDVWDRAEVVIDRVRALSGGGPAVHPDHYFQFRLALLNWPEWMGWVAREEFLMALFWAEMAYKGDACFGGGLGRVVLRRDLLKADSIFFTAPF